MKNLAARIAAQKERLGILAIGWLGNAILVYGFDYGLYPWVIFKLGTVQGGVVMFFSSLLNCLLTFVFYRWAKKDWLGIEMMKEVRDSGKEGKNKATKFFLWMLRKGDWLAFLALSIKFDPFITTIYMQEGANKYGELSKRDWTIFYGSVFVANLYWTGVMSGGVELVRYLATIWKGVI